MIRIKWNVYGTFPGPRWCVRTFLDKWKDRNPANLDFWFYSTGCRSMNRCCSRWWNCSLRSDSFEGSLSNNLNFWLCYRSDVMNEISLENELENLRRFFSCVSYRVDFFRCMCGLLEQYKQSLLFLEKFSRR